MSSTQHNVEPIRPGGGLRRLRRGEIGQNQQTEQTICSYPQFTASVRGELEQAEQQDTSVLLAQVDFEPLPGADKDSTKAQDVPDELTERLRSINERIKVTVLSPRVALVMIPALRRRADGESLAAEIGAALTPPIDVDGLPHHLMPSVGAALYDQENRSLEDLLSGARLALQSAEAGATVTMFHPYQRVRAGRQEKKEQQLRDAVLNDEISADLQPAYDAETGELVAFEALARWHREGRPSVAATEFLPMACDMGIMHQVSRLVIAKALLSVSGWLDENRPDADADSGDLTLWINVGPNEIRHPEFPDVIVAATEVDPRIKVGLEVGPGVVADERNVYRVITDLVARGAKAAMADFGVGPANLSVIEQLPYSAVKLNRELTRQMVQSSNGPAIVESLVAMASVLDFEITAQGIESREQLDQVRALGVDIVQGFLLAEPSSDLSTFPAFHEE